MNAVEMQRTFNQAPVHQRYDIYNRYARIYQDVEQNITHQEDQAQRRCLFCMQRILQTDPWLNIEFHDIYPTPQSMKNQDTVARQRARAARSTHKSAHFAPLPTILVNFLLFIVWLPFHALHMMFLAFIHVGDITTIRDNPRASRKYGGSREYRTASNWLYAGLILLALILTTIGWSC